MSDVLEAAQVRPWRAGEGPRPKVLVYEPGRRPMLRILATGCWQTCPAIARFDYPGGRTSYQVEVQLVRDGALATMIRAYWWDPQTMKPLQAGNPT